MQFRPKNKYLLVETAEEMKPEDKTSGFILPDDYKVKSDTHKVVKLVLASSGSSFIDSQSSFIVVPVNMIEEIKAFGKTYFLVPENAVYGVFHR